MVHDPLANCQPDTVASIMAVPMKAPEHVEDIVVSFFDTDTIIGYFKYHDAFDFCVKNAHLRN